jgi:hypothetical protein
MSSPSTMRKNRLNASHGGALVLDGDYTKRDLVAALAALRFDRAANVVLPIVIDQDIRDLLVASLGGGR